MRNKGKQQNVIRIVLSVGILLVLVIVGVLPKPQDEGNVAPDAADAPAVTEFGATLQELLKEIVNQEAVDQMILEELASGAYTFEEPLVIEDPYDTSPLTALIAFHTDSPSTVSIKVYGKTSSADVDFTFDTYDLEHLIPVYGLYEEQENSVELTATMADGRQQTNCISVCASKITGKRNNLIINTYVINEKSLQGGMTFTYENKLAFDMNGDIRWINTRLSNPVAGLLDYKAGTYIDSLGAVNQGDALLFERNLLGKISNIWYSPYGVHHDIVATGIGTLLVTGSSGDGSSVEDFIYEIDELSGGIVNSLDIKTVLPRSSSRLERDIQVDGLTTSSSSIIDWLHNNAIVYMGDSIIISGRNNSSLVKMKWPSGEIEWILASHYGWPLQYQQYLLAPANEGEFEWTQQQHAPELLPDLDQNEDTIDIMVFDNGNYRYREDADLVFKVQNHLVPRPEEYSRMVHYRVNEKEKTVEQIWQYGKERGEELHSSTRGDADLLMNGNRLGLFSRFTNIRDQVSQYTVIPEVNVNGELQWEALLTSENGHLLEYRVERLPLYRESDYDLRIGTKTNILIPPEVLAANGVIWDE